MKTSQRDRLLELVAHPPPGSKIEAAKQYGVDLTLNVRRLLLSPTERMREMEGALRLVEEMHRASQQVRL
jgi:hypothetical protein